MIDYKLKRVLRDGKTTLAQVQAHRGDNVTRDATPDEIAHAASGSPETGGAKAILDPASGLVAVAVATTDLAAHVQTLIAAKVNVAASAPPATPLTVTEYVRSEVLWVREFRYDGDLDDATLTANLDGEITALYPTESLVVGDQVGAVATLAATQALGGGTKVIGG